VGMWLLTCIPRPSPDKMHVERQYNGPNKQPDKNPECSTVGSRDIKENMYSGGGMLTL
jgi:hypothetical protein